MSPAPASARSMNTGCPYSGPSGGIAPTSQSGTDRRTRPRVRDERRGHRQSRAGGQGRRVIGPARLPGPADHQPRTPPSWPTAGLARRPAPPPPARCTRAGEDHPVRHMLLSKEAFNRSWNGHRQLLTLFRGLSVHMAVRPIHPSAAARRALRRRARFRHWPDDFERLLAVATDELIDGHSAPL